MYGFGGQMANPDYAGNVLCSILAHGGRIFDAPVCGHRLARPDGAGFAGGIVANGEYEIERRRAGRGARDPAEPRSGAAPLPRRSLGPRTTLETPVGPNEWRLTYGDVGVMTVRDGRRIEVAPVHGASRRTVRLAVLGQGMAVLLHQRGFAQQRAELARGALPLDAPHLLREAQRPAEVRQHVHEIGPDVMGQHEPVRQHPAAA